MAEYALKRVIGASRAVQQDQAALVSEAEELLKFEADACCPAQDPGWEGGYDG